MTFRIARELRLKLREGIVNGSLRSRRETIKQKEHLYCNNNNNNNNNINNNNFSEKGMSGEYEPAQWVGIKCRTTGISKFQNCDY